jgi:hypothetical protein
MWRANPLMAQSTKPAPGFVHQGCENDKLFQASYRHVRGPRLPRLRSPRGTPVRRAGLDRPRNPLRHHRVWKHAGEGCFYACRQREWENPERGFAESCTACRFPRVCRYAPCGQPFSSSSQPVGECMHQRRPTPADDRSGMRKTWMGCDESA